MCVLILVQYKLVKMFPKVKLKVMLHGILFPSCRTATALPTSFFACCRTATSQPTNFFACCSRETTQPTNFFACRSFATAGPTSFFACRSAATSQPTSLLGNYTAAVSIKSVSYRGVVSVCSSKNRVWQDFSPQIPFAIFLFRQVIYFVNFGFLFSHGYKWHLQITIIIFIRAKRN